MANEKQHCRTNTLAIVGKTALEVGVIQMILSNDTQVRFSLWTTNICNDSKMHIGRFTFIVSQNSEMKKPLEKKGKWWITQKSGWETIRWEIDGARNMLGNQEKR